MTCSLTFPSDHTSHVFPTPALGAVDLARKPARGIGARIASVSKVGRRDVQRTVADGVGGVAVDLGLLGREVGDTAIVLAVLGVAEEDDTLDLVLDGRVEF